MRLIDADALMQAHCSNCLGGPFESCLPGESDSCEFRAEILRAPTIGSTAAVHVAWVDCDYDWKACSVCGWKAYPDQSGAPIMSRYCPECGARMDGTEADERGSGSDPHSYLLPYRIPFIVPKNS